LPNHATRQDIEDAYLLAYKTGCLGITVFRDGSKDTQVLHVGTQKKSGKTEIKAETSQPISKTPKVRPISLQGTTYRKNTPVGAAYITVNANGNGNKEPFEVFINVGKAGSDVAADAEGLGRLISLMLRMPSPLSAHERAQDIIGQLRGIGSGRAQGFGKYRVMSLSDAVAQALAEHVGLNATDDLPGLPDFGEDAQLPLPLRIGDLCPECGQATFVFEEGCKKCHSCGHSEC
jgi:ribonucleoside-diphosphate reductase alpha chain